MPATKLQRKPKHFELSVLISGTVKTNETDRASLAKIMGCSEPTVTRRFKDPGSLTLDELTALGRGLHIPIDDLRAAIRY